MAPTSPRGQTSNSLLNMLNPYASIAQSTSISRDPSPSSSRREPDSPSTMLLRELQGGNSNNSDGDTTAEPVQREQRERTSLSPTPTPTARQGTYVVTSTSTSTTSSDDEGAPPASIMFGEQPAPNGNGIPGDRTPRSPPGALPRAQRHPFTSGGGRSRTAVQAGSASPGPFASSSASGSRSTSPGPSSISVYASILDTTGTIASSSAITSNASTRTSRDPSTSPERTSIRLPTFREPPLVRSALDDSSAGTGTGTKKGSSPRPAQAQGPGYLDPSVPPPSGLKGRTKDKDKGKGKAKNQGGRTYHALPNRDEGEDEEEEEGAGRGGRYAGLGGRIPRAGTGLSKSGLSDYEKALWKWVNVEDLDRFLQEVYDYYKGNGIFCIALARVLSLLTTFFVIAFSTFLSSCIDYTKLTSSVSEPNSVGRLDDVLIGQCITGGSFVHKIFIISVAAYYIVQLADFALYVPRLIEMYRFYTHLLGIPDADIQTLPWPEIVRLVGEIRKHNPVTSLSNGQAVVDMVGDVASQGPVAKLDAHDIANRILRQENYLIALFNKDLLDLRVRLPIPHALDNLVPSSLLAPASSAATALPSHSGAKERQYITFGANTLTTALEWNIRYCLMAYLFDQHGQVRKRFVRERKRKDLVNGLRTRFIFMGLLNILFAPFIVLYLLMYSFFRYFEEYHKNPSSIGSRQYTLYAQWKFREFNELPHLFERRLARSYPTAKEYIDQFPKERTALVMQFVAFVAGSFAAVLLVASLLDPDLFLHFEITPHRTVLFYLGVFGSVLAIARGMVPEENLVFDPEASLREVVRWTHYLPGEWKGKLHSQRVHQEFGQLFALKITVFFTELLSVILTPFILLFSLPPCAGTIIDFFREFTVHVDSLGYVCSFAVFDFHREGAQAAMTSTNGGDGGGDGLEPAPDAPLAAGGATAAAIRMAPDTPAARRRTKAGVPPGLGGGRERDWHKHANENKMEKSFLHFKATHPDWQPTDPGASLFLDQLMGVGVGERLPPHQYQYHQNGARPSDHNGGNGGMSSSIYAGGRGLGLGLGPGMGVGGGMDENRLRERSKSYDRAWAKSSHLLKPTLTSSPNTHTHNGLQRELSGHGHVQGQDSTILEEEDEETQAMEAMGWHKNIRAERLGARGEGGRGGEDGGGEEEEGEEEGGLWGDEGVRGILQQVLRR